MGTAWRAEHRLAQAGDALSAGRPAQARRLAQPLAGRTVDARAARLGATAALQQGDLAAAERELSRAIAAAPNDWSLHRDRAVLLRRLGRTAAARVAIARALALNPRQTLPPGFSTTKTSSP